MIACARYLLGDYSGAIEADRRAMHENPNQTLCYRWLAAAQVQLGRTAEAQGILRDLASILPPERFDKVLGDRTPWMREEDHARLLDGLRKAGWQG
jgi:adenylate cyclase